MPYVAGQYHQICDVCGFKFLSGETRKRWDGLLVCPADYETDHPQKYIRVNPDGQGVPNIRPEPEDNFRYVCTIFGRTPAANIGEADCMTVGALPNIPYPDYGYPTPFEAELFPLFPSALRPAIPEDYAMRYFVYSGANVQGPTEWALTYERPYQQAVRLAREHIYNQPLTTCWVDGVLQGNPFEYTMVAIPGQPTYTGMATPVWNNARDESNNLLPYCEASENMTIWHELRPQFSAVTYVDGLPYTVSTSERVFP